MTLSESACPTRRRCGFFITVEGPEGAGKSTVIARLLPELARRGHTVVPTREPGGSEGGEAVRALLVNGPAGRWDAEAELLLMAAARRDHVVRVIRPALDRGDWVLCDRFIDSMWAYQGGGRGLVPTAIAAVNAVATDGLEPDLTLILDLDPAAGLARAAGRRHAETRFESLDLEFHHRVRAAFQAIAASNPDRCRQIDAHQPADAVHKACLSAILAAARRSGGTDGR